MSTIVSACQSFFFARTYCYHHSDAEKQNKMFAKFFQVN
jgi:hypothetical protein